MHLHDIARSSLGNLKRNRLRTALSLLGIVIGVFSVTIIISLGVAVKGAIIGYVESFVGRNFVSINPAVPGASRENSMRALMMGGGSNSLDYADIEALADHKNLPYATAVNGVVSGQEYLRYGNKEYRSIIAGASSTYPLINPVIKVGQGRFFNDEEVKAMSPMIVLGIKVAGKLFGSEDPLGKSVKIRGIPTQVVGVLEPAGSIMNIDMDTMALLPLRFMQKRLLGIDKVTEAHVKVVDEAHVDQTVFDIERLLRKRHNITDPAKDDFQVTKATDIMDRLNTITDVITYFLGFLAAISLLVGGIGIMNIMLVSVTERIREVGLRKALGAKPRDIMLQFLAESVTLTTAGGLIGGALGFLLALVIIAVMNYYKLNVPYTVSLEAFVGAAIVSAFIGILFGIQPARKAAALDPITSLRFE